QRDQIQTHIDSHKALISHPRRLPVDILREIFVACLPANRNAVMSAQEAPLLLGRICSAWRTITLSTPRLWASLHIPLDHILDNEARKLAATEWVQRSGVCPILLAVFSERSWKSWGCSKGLFEEFGLLKSLADFSTRRQHLKLLNLPGIPN
ncbi:hypothetical protein DFH08DRAFT_685584, partial [Mycena albidolilacea]